MIKDGVTKYALYDLGSSTEVLQHNLTNLSKTDISLALNTIIISHWHQDHSTDNLINSIAYIYSINGNTPITLHFSGPDSKDFPGGVSGEVIPKNTLSGSGRKYSFDNPTVQQLQDISYLTVVFTPGPRVILDGWLFLNNLMPVTYNDVSGGQQYVPSVQRPTTYNWMNNHIRWWDRSIPDASKNIIMAQKFDQCAEDTFAVCNVKNYGLGIISGCGHCGLVNMLIDILSRESYLTSRTPLYFLFGGMHLDPLSNQFLQEVGYIINKLVKDHNTPKTLRPLLMSLSHCSSSSRVLSMMERYSENDRILCPKITSVGSEQKFGISA